MPEPAPSLSIIIPNYNGAALLRQNLPAVVAALLEYPGPGRLIVVDDASSDESCTVPSGISPVIELLRHPENRGFAEAIWSGVAASDSELLVFLNSDVRPDADFLQPLVRHFADPSVFSVGPLILDERGRLAEETWRCYHLHRGKFRALKRRGQVPPGPRPTLFNSGGSMVLRRSQFLALGGFAPIFKPFYGEDSDLGMRAWRRGWRSLVEPAGRVVHDHSHSSIQSNVPSARVQRIRRRNRFLLEWIHLPTEDLLFRLLPAYLLQACMRLVRLDCIYFAGLSGALRRIPEVLRARREIAASATRDFWGVMEEIRNAERATGD